MCTCGLYVVFLFGVTCFGIWWGRVSLVIVLVLYRRFCVVWRVLLRISVFDGGFFVVAGDVY